MMEGREDGVQPKEIKLMECSVVLSRCKIPSRSCNDVVIISSDDSSDDCKEGALIRVFGRKLPVDATKVSKPRETIPVIISSDDSSDDCQERTLIRVTERKLPINASKESKSRESIPSYLKRGAVRYQNCKDDFTNINFSESDTLVSQTSQNDSDFPYMLVRGDPSVRNDQDFEKSLSDRDVDSKPEATGSSSEYLCSSTPLTGHKNTQDSRKGSQEPTLNRSSSIYFEPNKDIRQNFQRLGVGVTSNAHFDNSKPQEQNAEYSHSVIQENSTIEDRHTNSSFASTFGTSETNKYLYGNFVARDSKHKGTIKFSRTQKQSAPQSVNKSAVRPFFSKSSNGESAERLKTSYLRRSSRRTRGRMLEVAPALDVGDINVHDAQSKIPSDLALLTKSDNLKSKEFNMPPVGLVVNVGAGFPLTLREANVVSSWIDQQFQSLTSPLAELCVSVVKLRSCSSSCRKLIVPVVEKKTVDLMQKKWKAGIPLTLTTLESLSRAVSPFGKPKRSNHVKLSTKLDVASDKDSLVDVSLIKMKTDTNKPTFGRLRDSKLVDSDIKRSEKIKKRIVRRERKEELQQRILHTLLNSEPDDDSCFSKLKPAGVFSNVSSAERSTKCFKESICSTNKTDNTSKTELVDPLKSILARDKSRVLAGSSGLRRSLSSDPDETSRTIIPESEKNLPEPAYDPDDTRGLEDPRIDASRSVETWRGKSKLSHELRRLNVALFDVSDTSTDITCRSLEPCRLGCVCQSLYGQVMREHCGKVKCMFVCSCSDHGNKASSSFNDPAFAWIQEKAKKNLAREEQQFKLTAVRSSNDSVMLVENKRKREIKLPGRYRDDFLLASERDRDLRVKSQGLGKMSKKDIPLISKSKPSHVSEKKSSGRKETYTNVNATVSPDLTSLSMSNDDLLFKKKQHISSLSTGSLQLLKNRALLRSALIKRSRLWKRTYGSFRNRNDGETVTRPEKEKCLKTLFSSPDKQTSLGFLPRTSDQDVDPKILPCSVLLDASVVGRYLRLHKRKEISFSRNIAVKSTAVASHGHDILRHSARTSSYVMKVKNQWAVVKQLAAACAHGKNFVTASDQLACEGKSTVKVANERSNELYENQVSLQILSVQSLPFEHWDDSTTEQTAEMSVPAESTIFSSYFSGRHEHDVVLLPANVLQEEVLSEKVCLWLNMNKTKGKGRIFISEGPVQPCPDSLDVRFIPVESEEYKDIPFSIKALRSQYCSNPVEGSCMWIAKLHKTQWTLVGFLQPDEKTDDKEPSASETENIGSILPCEMLRSDQPSSFRWWMMSVHDVFDHIVFFDYNVVVHRDQLISLLQLSNLNLNKGQIHRIILTRKGAGSSATKFSPNPDFGIYGLPGLPNHVVIGPYEITQEPKLNVFSRQIIANSGGFSFKRLPLVCCGLKQSVKVNSRGVLSSTVDSMPPKCVKGYWLHSSKSGDSNSYSPQDSTIIGLESNSSVADLGHNTQLVHDEPTNCHNADVITSGKRNQPRKASRKQSFVQSSPKVTRVSKSYDTQGPALHVDSIINSSKTDSEVEKKYLIPNIRCLGYITVSCFPNNTFSIPHLRKPGLLQFFRSIDEIITDVNVIIHKCIAAKSVRCLTTHGSSTECSCVKWKTVPMLQDFKDYSPINHNIFYGFFIWTSRGLFDVRKLSNSEVKDIEGDWNDWMLNGRNFDQLRLWKKFVDEKRKVLYLCEKLGTLLRGHDQGVRLPIGSVLKMAVTEIEKLEANEQLLCLEKRTQKLIRKSLLASLNRNLDGIPVDFEGIHTSHKAGEDGSILEGDHSPTTSQALHEPRILKKRKMSERFVMNRIFGSSSRSDFGQPKGIVHHLSPFSRLNIAVEEGGIVQTPPVVGGIDNNEGKTGTDNSSKSRSDATKCSSYLYGFPEGKSLLVRHPLKSSNSEHNQRAVPTSSPSFTSSKSPTADSPISKVSSPCIGIKGNSAFDPEVKEAQDDVFISKKLYQSPDILTCDELGTVVSNLLASSTSVKSLKGGWNSEDQMINDLFDDKIYNTVEHGNIETPKSSTPYVWNLQDSSVKFSASSGPELKLSNVVGSTNSLFSNDWGTPNHSHHMSSERENQSPSMVSGLVASHGKYIRENSHSSQAVPNVTDVPLAEGTEELCPDSCLDSLRSEVNMVMTENNIYVTPKLSNDAVCEAMESLHSSEISTTRILTSTSLMSNIGVTPSHQTDVRDCNVTFSFQSPQENDMRSEQTLKSCSAPVTSINTKSIVEHKPVENVSSLHTDNNLVSLQVHSHHALKENTASDQQLRPSATFVVNSSLPTSNSMPSNKIVTSTYTVPKIMLPANALNAPFSGDKLIVKPTVAGNIILTRAVRPVVSQTVLTRLKTPDSSMTSQSAALLRRPAKALASSSVGRPPSLPSTSVSSVSGVRPVFVLPSTPAVTSSRPVNVSSTSYVPLESQAQCNFSTAGMPSASAPKPLYVVSASGNRTTSTCSNKAFPLNVSNPPNNGIPSSPPASKLTYVKLCGLKAPVVVTTSSNVDPNAQTTLSSSNPLRPYLSTVRRELKVDSSMLLNIRGNGDCISEALHTKEHEKVISVISPSIFQVADTTKVPTSVKCTINSQACDNSLKP